jgi:hypothetical protein
MGGIIEEINLHTHIHEGSFFYSHFYRRGKGGDE